MGNEEFKKGNHAKAIEYYTYATEMDPNNPIFYTNRSFAYFKMGQNEKSLRDALKATKKDPQWAKGFYRAGCAQMELGQHEEAHKSFKSAADIDPKKAEFAMAASKAKAAMMSGMTQAEVLKTEANEHFKSGRVDDAIKGYTNALSCAGPEEASLKADVLANRAACYRQLYEPDNVIADCTEALAINAQHVKAMIRRAQAYESMERYKKALGDFEAACRLAPNMQVAYQGASRIRNAMKKLGMM